MVTKKVLLGTARALPIFFTQEDYNALRKRYSDVPSWTTFRKYMSIAELGKDKDGRKKLYYIRRK